MKDEIKTNEKIEVTEVLEIIMKFPNDVLRDLANVVVKVKRTREHEKLEKTG